MRRIRIRRAPSALFTAAIAALGAVSASACGGGGGGGGGGGTGLVLVNFNQDGEDNVPLNRVLEFQFSAPLDPNSIGPASIQIRQGPTFGQSVFGKYIIEGSTVRFEPALPGRCDLSDGGFKPDTNYRVTVIGSPEEFAVRALSGAALAGTTTASFHTRLDTDPQLFEDQIPSISPTVVSTTPIDGAYPTDPDPAVVSTVLVHQGNSVTIDFSENINPCSISKSTVIFQQYATGSNTTTYPNGFFPETDQTPSDPFTWGSGNLTTPPRTIRSTYSLHQDFLTTRLTITPTFGEFPDNALLVVQVTNSVVDFGGLPLVPHTFAFVTENRTLQVLDKVLEFNGDVPILANQSTAEVNTARAASKVQGFLLFAGDGDNGPTATILQPSGPDSSKGPSGCTTGTVQTNDGLPDDFDPTADVNLDTGATLNTCVNPTDGSTAATYEFRSFHIKSGVTVRVVGRNPAIFLVSGDVKIEAGGAMRARGDGGNGAPQSNASNGQGGQSGGTGGANGGTGVAGGGDGGKSAPSNNAAQGPIYGNNGAAGFGSPDFGQPAGTGAPADAVRVGAGRGTGSLDFQYSGAANANRTAPSGGGGGHAQAAAFDNNGKANGTGSTPRALDFPSDPDGPGGRGGAAYGAVSGRMPTAEAGSGGGAGGLGRSLPFTSSTFYQATGGGGGAGGGFVDFTSSGNIAIFGELDASGGRGGNAGLYCCNGFYQGSGGGGGGSGGGIRLLTPGMIDLQSTTILRAAGGAAGNGIVNGPAPANPGGPGGTGRLVFEDGDSIIGGFGGALVSPTDGAAGFYRSIFDASRFQGGGLRPLALTDVVDMGPAVPSYLSAQQNYGVVEDFIAGIPAVASRGIGKTGIYIEARGYNANADGTVNTTSPTAWASVGYFTNSGSELFPTFTANAQPPVADVPASQLPAGSTANPFSLVNLRPFLQFRFSFYLPSTIGPFDPGPYIDRWTIHIQYDQ